MNSHPRIESDSSRGLCDLAIGGFILAMLTAIAARAAPPNDNLANAVTISGTVLRITDTNSAATKETGEPEHAGNGGGASVWWSWTAPHTATVSIDTWGTTFDAALAVYTGNSIDALAAVASDHNSGGANVSALSFGATAGTTYFIAVAGFSGATGAISLNLIAMTVDVTTLAGSPGSPGVTDGTGNAARFNNPTGIVVDAAGNLIVPNSGTFTVRKITPSAEVTTLAGLAGVQGAVDGTAANARFRSIWGVATNAAGEFFVGDLGNHTIRKVTATGEVTTFAGAAGAPGTTDGPLASARFRRPIFLAFDRNENLYVSDLGNHSIRKITPSGAVSTLAGEPGVFGSSDGSGASAHFRAPFGIAVDAAGTIYVCDTGNRAIRRITPDRSARWPARQEMPAASTALARLRASTIQMASPWIRRGR